MIAKCANPFCSNSFRYFRDGRLFRVELARRQSAQGEPVRDSRWFWLCGECAANITLTVDGEHAIFVARQIAKKIA